MLSIAKSLVDAATVLEDIAKTVEKGDRIVLDFGDEGIMVGVVTVVRKGKIHYRLDEGTKGSIEPNDPRFYGRAKTKRKRKTPIPLIDLDKWVDISQNLPRQLTKRGFDKIKMDKAHANLAKLIEHLSKTTKPKLYIKKIEEAARVLMTEFGNKKIKHSQFTVLDRLSSVVGFEGPDRDVPQQFTEMPSGMEQLIREYSIEFGLAKEKRPGVRAGGELIWLF